MPNATEPQSNKTHWAHVYRTELRALLGRQKAKDQTTLDEEEASLRRRITGLALSGGGIRSASFSLGVVQSLAEHRCIRNFHYLSTVSGGGYTGVAVSWLRKLYGEKWQVQLHSPGTRSRSAPKAGEEHEQSGNNEAIWLDFLRQHGNYLQPPPMGVTDLVGVALRNLVLSLFVYVGLLSAGMALLHRMGMYTEYGSATCAAGGAICYDLNSLSISALSLVFVSFLLYSLSSFVTSLSSKAEKIGLIVVAMIPTAMIVSGISIEKYGLNFTDANVRARSTLILVGICSLALSSVFVVRRFRNTKLRDDKGDKDLYEARVFNQAIGGYLLTFALLIAFSAALPKLYNAAAKILELPAATLLASTALAYRTFAGGRVPFTTPRVQQVSIVLIFCCVVVSLGLCSYAVAYWLQDAAWQLHLSFFVAILTVAFCTNLNQFGIGRMYRDRLMETFMPDRASISHTRWSLATQANSKLGQLARLWRRSSGSNDGYLYPIINSNVVLVDSKTDTFRGRGGDSFVFSPMFCGSDATQWVRTREFSDGEFMAGTAMAISGAAANPNTAPGGHGFSRNRLVSFLMFLSQARLGAWVANPNAPDTAINKIRRFVLRERPNFLSPGIVGGLFGRELSENSYFIELTDGGHFDNTGVYELIRRRSRLILLSQASQDSDFRMSDLANLIEKIRVDFDARIFFSDGTPIEDLVPRHDGKFTLPSAKKGYAVGKISYSDESIGWLVYIQATPVKELALDVHSYHLANPDFPNEPTADQFFREAQLEAYRELGHSLCDRFINDVKSSHGSSDYPEDHCINKIHSLLFRESPYPCAAVQSQRAHD